MAGTKPEKPNCTVPACERKQVARGFCGLHYRHWRTGKITASGVPRLRPGRRPRTNGATPARRKVPAALTKSKNGTSSDGVLVLQLSALSRQALGALLVGVSAGKQIDDLVSAAIENWAS